MAIRSRRRSTASTISKSRPLISERSKFSFCTICRTAKSGSAGGPALTKANVVIEGGVRIRDIKLDSDPVSGQ